METKDVVSGVGTFFAIVLGVYNYLYARKNDRVQLQVTPQVATRLANSNGEADGYRYTQNRSEVTPNARDAQLFAINVVNVGKFAITLNEVGLMKRGQQPRFTFRDATDLGGNVLPRRLEPREDVTLHFKISALRGVPELTRATRAYAHTACGEFRYGNSAALRELADSDANAG